LRAKLLASNIEGIAARLAAAFRHASGAYVSMRSYT
jgi:hypothetical protein